MNHFKVIASKGFSFGGKLYEKGQTFQAENKSAHVQTALHFKQIVTHEPSEKDAAKESAKESGSKSEKDAAK